MRALVSRKGFRENIALLAISFFVFLHEPAIVRAQEASYEAVNFTQPLPLSRGSMEAGEEGSVYLSHTMTCAMTQEEYGWEPHGCDDVENAIFGYLPGVDTILVRKPDSSGFVKLDDWSKDSTKDDIDELWVSFKEGAKEQSRSLGVQIMPEKWLVYPKVNQQQSFMYYAILMNWDNEPVININATRFDRHGYVAFDIVPSSDTATEAEIEAMVEKTLAKYQPAQNQAYFDFREGDKIAAAGAMGVLATLMGVKYGKAASAGLLAIILGFAKKLWFLILIPFAFLKKFLSKN